MKSKTGNPQLCCNFSKYVEFFSSQNLWPSRKKRISIKLYTPGICKEGFVFLNRCRMTQQSEVLGKKKVFAQIGSRCGFKFLRFFFLFWSWSNDHLEFPSTSHWLNVWHVFKAARWSRWKRWESRSLSETKSATCWWSHFWLRDHRCGKTHPPKTTLRLFLLA